MKLSNVPFRLAALLLASIGLVLLASAGPASAATISKYAPNAAARNFTNSLSGWNGSVFLRRSLRAGAYLSRRRQRLPLLRWSRRSRRRLHRDGAWLAARRRRDLDRHLPRSRVRLQGRRWQGAGERQVQDVAPGRRRSSARCHGQQRRLLGCTREAEGRNRRRYDRDRPADDDGRGKRLDLDRAGHG